MRVRCGPTSDRVLVRMLKGQAPDAWERVAVNLAHGFGATLVRVRNGDRPGRIWLEFIRRDALAVPMPALPVPDGSDVDLSGLVIGRCEDGSPWRLRLLGTHVLIAGRRGRQGLGHLVHHSRTAALDAVRVGGGVGGRPKRMELSFGRALFERYGRYSSDPSGGMVKLLETAAEDMNARAERFAGVTRSFTPSHEHPFRVVVVDELAFLTAYCPERDLRKRAESALAVLTSQGRSVGYCVIGAQQDARKEVNNLRNLFPDRIALRLDEDEQVDMVLGDGARDRGALADQISSVPEVGAGVGFVRLEASPDPVRVRAAYVADSDIRDMVALGLPDVDVRGRRETTHPRRPRGRLILVGRTRSGTGRQDAGSAGAGRAGSGRGRTRRVRPSSPHAAGRPQHGRGRDGLCPVRSHPGLGVPVVRRTQAQASRGAVPSRLAPGRGTGHHAR